jgi:voltage-gated potassium channel
MTQDHAGPHALKDPRAATSKYERATDGPLTVLALLMFPLLVVPLVKDLSDGWDRILQALDYLIWAVFAFDYAARFYLTPNRARFVRTHIPDLVIVLVPFLRPLRLLRSARLFRLLRLSRLAAFGMNALSQLRTIFRSRGLNYIVLVVLALILISSLVILEFERSYNGANIKTYTDALWWAVATVTTVGYGDLFPISPAGRGVAVMLTVVGIALFGVITATIAAHFVEQDMKSEATTQDDILDRLTAIDAHVQDLDKALGETTRQVPERPAPSRRTA